MQIGKDKVVAIDYTLTDPQGQVLDTSQGREPLSYVHGTGNIIRGLEQALEGKGTGDTLQVQIPPDQAYGEKDPAMVQAVPRAAFRGITDIKPGMQFQAQNQGAQQVVTVVGVTDEEVTVDANHPLAGVTLNFDVNIVSVRDATPEELQHGHAHGVGGQQH
jgi:FKBP-type peptidyl-prolyl cis-trans isomerase SlyD